MVIQSLIYRIEFPYMSDDDQGKIEEFKSVLENVLNFEKNPCPFARELEPGPLQERQLSPRTRRRGPYQKAKRWDFNDIRKRVGEEDYFTACAEGSNTDTSEEVSSIDSVTENTQSTRKTSVGSRSSDEAKTPIRPRHLEGSRSVTVPLIFGFGIASSRHYSLDALEEGELESTPKDNRSLSSSLDSFHTSYESLSASVLSTPSLAFEPPLTPELCSVDLDHVCVHSHTRDNCETTITSVTPRTCKSGMLRTELSLEPIDTFASDDLYLDSRWKETCTQPSPVRQKHSPSLNCIFERPQTPINRTIFTASPSSRPSDDITSRLVSKTCAILLSPPPNLFSTMVRIAARMANAALAGVPGICRFRPKHGNWYKVPGKWEDSDDDLEKDDWPEDDYVVALGNESGNP